MQIDLIDSLRYFLTLTFKLALLFVGISFMVGLIQEFVPQKKIENILGGRRNPILNNVFGAGLGALTPFCSCSTIPVVLGLLKAKAQFGAVMSFLIASPLLNPIIISLIVVLMGFRNTVIYVAVVFPAAVITGLIWEKIGLSSEIKTGAVHQDCCGSEMISFTGKSQNSAKVSKAFTSAWSLFRQMFPWLLLGAAIGALIYGVIPEELIVSIAGPNNPLAIPLAAIVGIPMYVRAATMLPIGSILLTKGMGIGAVMALIIGGSGASIPELFLLAAIFKRKLVIAFILTVLSVAVLAGVLFSLLSQF